MRAFSSSSVRGALLVAAFFRPLPGAAQWPGEISGQVVEEGTGRAVSGADVSIEGTELRATSGAAGGFHLRGVPPGPRTLRVEHLGHAAVSLAVEVLNGRATHLRIVLPPAPLEVRGMRVSVRRTGSGEIVVRPATATGGGARTAGDLLAAAPGVVVSRRGPGSPEAPSIRGSAPDAVLVLVDGAPLHDPVTGEADLSRVAASDVASIRVLPGARTARWGPRAEAGVILIETRGPAPGPRFGVAAGSLGARRGNGSWGVGLAGGGASVGVRAERLGGGFDFERPAEAGGGAGVRENADLLDVGVRAALDAPFAGGRLRLGADAGRLERGLPGRSFAPSPHARQLEHDLGARGAWRRGTVGRTLRLALHGRRLRVRFADPDPPLGLPYDRTTTVDEVGARSEISGVRPGSRVPAWAAGAELGVERVRSDALAPEAPGPRLDAGLFASGELALGGAWTLAVTGRLHRDPATNGVHPAHALAVRGAVGPVALHAAHRSAYSPPALADQHFREGVGVQPNPELGPERVPSEVEVGLAGDLAVGPAAASISAVAWAGDVRGMIVWQPDFRFVWSPRNVDVVRRGVEIRGGAEVPFGPGTARLEASWSHARVTFDRDDDPGVQLPYRPRNSARIAAGWDGPRASASLEARYTGLRYPVPAPVNGLDGFWAADLVLSRRWAVGAWTVEPLLRIDRLLGARDSMIFAFPEPGRVWTLELSLLPRRGPRPTRGPGEMP